MTTTNAERTQRARERRNAEYERMEKALKEIIWTPGISIKVLGLANEGLQKWRETEKPT